MAKSLNLILLFFCLGIVLATRAADRDDFNFHGAVSWSFAEKNLEAGGGVLYYPWDTLGVGPRYQTNPTFDFGGVEVRWSVEPFELWLAGGAASPDFKEWVLLGLGGLNYLIALTDSISLVNQAQFYLGDKRFEGLLLGLGARVIY